MVIFEIWCVKLVYYFYISSVPDFVDYRLEDSFSFCAHLFSPPLTLCI